MKKIIIFIIIILLIPLIIVDMDKKNNSVNKMYYGIYNNQMIKVKLSNNGNIIELPIEEYVLGVVAGEMPASFQDEALKAQAVASRTYALNKMSKNNEYDITDTTNDQVYITKEKMKEKWNSSFEKNYEKIKKIINDTSGEVILYNNKLIDAMFFSTSNGYTENSEDVFSSSLPYLKSVDSKWDKEESPVFSTNNKISKLEFINNLGLEGTNEIKITDVNKTKTGRIKNLKINGKLFNSNYIRNVFNLKSTSFSIKEEDNYIIFEVFGFGHGVGLSQYGANGMAKEGYNYKDILNHYYKDCEIKKIN